MADKRQPWERMEMESGPAYEAFKLFLGLGMKRSVAEASRQYHARNRQGGDRTDTGKRPQASGWVREWAKRWNWRERAAAWDAEQDRQEQQDLARARREMTKRQAGDAKALQNLAKTRFGFLTEKVAANKAAIEELPLDEARHLYTEAAKLERLSLGEPGEIEERRLTGRNGGPIEVVELTDDDLSRIAAGEEPQATGSRGTAPAA